MDGSDHGTGLLRGTGELAMAYVTKAMRDRARADRLEDVAGADLQLMRRLDGKFSERAISDRQERYPELTADNAGVAIKFQEERIKEQRDGCAEYQAALKRVLQVTR